ncbi:hypothetical protein [Cardiobacterium hominis]|uniref:hypothetical protein n=1 Tax=Cardiobacterium hominis TaxID=2718 RepID=UPI0028E337ED|nr:hypothetical protein [Cardiobacterium hominis]
MTVEQCFWGICFIPLDGSGQKFFGFSEFLAGLALMVLAWTTADVRYRFRVRSAPIPLLGITFSVVAAVGVLTLLTDLWRAEQWLVPKGNLLTPASWQAILGGLFLLTFLTWTWFAFIRPPTYSRHNAERFAWTLYRFILKGSPAELAVIADELAYSARALVHHATDWGRQKHHRLEQEDEKKNSPKVVEYANDLLLLIADKRLCRAIVESSPGTALAVFQTMADMKKYGIQVEVFAKNIVSEALANKDSFLYHEVEGYQSGLIGDIKPLSQAMFSNYEMVETIGTLLDPDPYSKRTWDAAQWGAYCRMVLMTFRSYVEEGHRSHSFVLFRAKENIEYALFDLYKLNGVANSAWDDDLQSRLRVIVKFIKDAVEILERKEVPHYLKLRIRDKYRPASKTFYDHIASLIFEVVFAASAVTAPSLCRWIQYSLVWSELFKFDRRKGNAGAVVNFKVRRLLYDEIADMKRFPNFKGAGILRFCLNVIGLTISPDDHHKDSRALHRAVLAWTKKNYVWLHGYNPRVAGACLGDGITYDAENRRLVLMKPAEGLRREPIYVYLDLDPPPPEHQAGNRD